MTCPRSKRANAAKGRLTNLAQPPAYALTPKGLGCSVESSIDYSLFGYSFYLTGLCCIDKLGSLAGSGVAGSMAFLNSPVHHQLSHPSCCERSNGLCTTWQPRPISIGSSQSARRNRLVARGSKHKPLTGMIPATIFKLSTT